MHHSQLLTTLQNLTKHKPTQQELADILGYSINTIGARATRDSSYSLEELKKISQAYGINILRDEIEPDLRKYIDDLASDYARKAQENDIVKLDYYPEVFGSCGGGVFVPSETKEKISVPKRFITRFDSDKLYSVITAYGDSMEPYIRDKDLLIVEHKTLEPVIDNRVYVFRYNDNLFVKRLILNVNQIIIKSDNADYDTIKLSGEELDNLQIIGRIAGLIRRM